MNIFFNPKHYAKIEGPKPTKSSSSSDSETEKTEKKSKLQELPKIAKIANKREKSKSINQPARAQRSTRTRSIKQEPLGKVREKLYDDAEVGLDMTSPEELSKSVVPLRRKETAAQRLAKTRNQEKFDCEFDRAAGIFSHHFSIQILPEDLKKAHSQAKNKHIKFKEIERETEKILLQAAATAFIEKHDMAEETHMYVQQALADYLDQYHGWTEDPQQSQQWSQPRNLLKLPGEIKASALENWKKDRINPEVSIQHFDANMIVEKSEAPSETRKSRLSMLPKKSRADRKHNEQLLAARCETEAQVFKNIGIAFSQEDLNRAQSSAKNLDPARQPAELRMSLRAIATNKFIAQHAPERAGELNFHTAVNDALKSYEDDLLIPPQERRFRKLVDVPRLILEEAKSAEL